MSDHPAVKNLKGKDSRCAGKVVIFSFLFDTLLGDRYR